MKRLFFSLVATIGAVAFGVSHAAPVIDPLLPPSGQSPRVDPNVPVGKTLLFPVTANNPADGALSYKVTSSNPNILVRVKTGNPALQISVNHPDGGANDPPYSGTMEFML